MPRVEIPCIEEHERETVEEALRIVSSAIIHDDMEIKLDTTVVPPKFSYKIHRNSGPYAEYGKHLDEMAKIIRDQINKGALAVTTSEYGNKIVENKRVVVSEYPDARMTDEEHDEFNDAINMINTGRYYKHCNFESFLDDTAHVIFRYSVSDDAPNKSELHDAIRLVIHMINEGKAVRVELPSNSVMFMPRFF